MTRRSRRRRRRRRAAPRIRARARRGGGAHVSLPPRAPYTGGGSAADYGCLAEAPPARARQPRACAAPRRRSTARCSQRCSRARSITSSASSTSSPEPLAILEQARRPRARAPLSVPPSEHVSRARAQRLTITEDRVTNLLTAGGGKRNVPSSPGGRRGRRRPRRAVFSLRTRGVSSRVERTKSDGTVCKPGVCISRAWGRVRGGAGARGGVGLGVDERGKAARSFRGAPRRTKQSTHQTAPVSSSANARASQMVHPFVLSATREDPGVMGERLVGLCRS